MGGDGKKKQWKYQVRTAVWMLLMAGIILLAVGCGRNQQTDPTAQTDQDPKQLETVENTDLEQSETVENADQKQPVILQNLHMDGSLLSQTFYQAGNINNRLHCYVRPGERGDEFMSNELGLAVIRMTPHFDEIAYKVSLAVNADTLVETVSGQNTYQAELSVRGYQNGEAVLEDVCSVTITLPSEDDMEKKISVQLSASSGEISAEAKALMGEYYPMPSVSDLFDRYLCRAELCAYPTEDLRLMRNTIYAAHGRKFQDQILTEYMENQPWYRGTTEPEDFSEEVLSDVEKSNIALLKELEQMPADQRRIMYGADYSLEDFAPSPYLSLLSLNQETGLSADLTQAEDCGAYLRVPGKLYLPVTLTREQWEHVRDGEKEELCINELTGEARILELDSTGNYRFYEKGTEPDITWPSDIRSCYLYDTGLYELQEASDDTIMKLVYEGDLYFLKGAVWGGMVSLTSASELQQEITPQMEGLYANRLYHNGRGYFTAVYGLGD